tara:strand:+ start:127 stop:714 length:588 start_codon:yes stop_codon:yes gene_type:complete
MSKIDTNRMFFNLFGGKSKIMDKVRELNRMSPEDRHMYLGGVGLASQGPLEPVGIAADLVDAGLYAREGDLGGAGLSLLSMVPGLGALAGLKKVDRLKEGIRRPKKKWLTGEDRLRQIDADNARTSARLEEINEEIDTFDKVADEVLTQSGHIGPRMKIDESVLKRFMESQGLTDPEEALILLQEFFAKNPDSIF